MARADEDGFYSYSYKYTGKTATSFTGCSLHNGLGAGGTMSTGDFVYNLVFYKILKHSISLKSSFVNSESYPMQDEAEKRVNSNTG